MNLCFLKLERPEAANIRKKKEEKNEKEFEDF